MLLVYYDGLLVILTSKHYRISQEGFRGLLNS